jgi:hypothetical protein
MSTLTLVATVVVVAFIVYAVYASIQAGLGEKLKASHGLPPAELRSFLCAALDAAGQFRTS